MNHECLRLSFCVSGEDQLFLSDLEKLIRLIKVFGRA
jgi:hypothetical protein